MTSLSNMLKAFMSFLNILPSVYASNRGANMIPVIPTNNYSYYLLSDINNDNAVNPNSDPFAFTKIAEGVAVFMASTNYSEAMSLVDGTGLYVSDSTLNEASLVTMFNMGTRALGTTSVGNGKVVLNLTEDYSTHSLYVTDGFATGTSLVGSYVGTTLQLDKNTINGKAIYSEFDPALMETTVSALDTSDNSTEIILGPIAGDVSIYINTEGHIPLNATTSLFFVRDNSTNDSALYKTDATSAGTELITTITGRSINNFANIGTDLVLFYAHSSTYGADYSLYATDGTASGTIELISTLNGKYSPVCKLANGIGVFTSTDSTNSYNEAIFITDGTAAGTHSIYSNIGYQFTLNNFVLPVDNDNCVTVGNHTEDIDRIYKVHTPTETVTYITPPVTADDYVRLIGNLKNGKLVILVQSGITRLNTLASINLDGTGYTVLLDNFQDSIENVENMGVGSIVFIIQDTANYTGFKIYTTDGTVEGTSLIKHVEISYQLYSKPYAKLSETQLIVIGFDTIVGSEPCVVKRL